MGEDDFYFPAGWIHDTNTLVDDTTRERYSRFLVALNAPSLSCGLDQIEESYRLLWLPSYQPTMVLTVGRSGTTWQLEVAEFEHPRFGHPWRVAQRSPHTVSAEKASELLAKLSRAEVWTIPSWEHSGANDGVIWVIEARLRNGYRVVTRVNPKDDDFKAAGRAFFAVAALSVPSEISR